MIMDHIEYLIDLVHDQEDESRRLHDRLQRIERTLDALFRDGHTDIRLLGTQARSIWAEGT